MKRARQEKTPSRNIGFVLVGSPRSRCGASTIILYTVSDPDPAAFAVYYAALKKQSTQMWLTDESPQQWVIDILEYLSLGTAFNLDKSPRHAKTIPAAVRNLDRKACGTWLRYADIHTGICHLTTCTEVIHFVMPSTDS